MTVHTFIGFDMFGQGMQTSGAPVANAGLSNNPAKLSTAGSTNFTSDLSIGVPGAERNKMGVGNYKRNTLAVHIRGLISSTITMRAEAPMPANMLPAGLDNQICIGFRYKVIRAEAGVIMVMPSNVGLLQVDAVTVLTNTGTTIRLGNTVPATPFPLKENQEYYIEVVIRRTNATSTATTMSLFIDGQQIISSVASTVALPGPATISFGGSITGFSGQQHNSQSNYADFYVGDTRLGPQVVLIREPSTQLEKNWTPSEGDDSVALISGANRTNDTKHIISPMTDEADKYRVQFSITGSYKANAAAVYLRGLRAPSSTRSILIQPYNQGTDALINEAGTAPILFSQQTWRTDLAWFTDRSIDLTHDNINNLGVKITSPEA